MKTAMFTAGAVITTLMAAGTALAEEDEETRGGQQSQDAIRPEVGVIAERGGVLTPRGALIVEPSIEYQNSNVREFTFQGVEVIDTVLLGVIQAGEEESDTITPAIGLRYGITNRLEVEVKVPYVYRDDRTSDEILTATSEPVDRSVSGGALGDIEFGAHYQLNSGTGGWPIFVGNLRVKSDTGRGPFDVDRDANGIETEPATGSGFWGVEPSLTMLLPTDPAVIFANIGYLWNIERDVDENVGGLQVGRVDPGDSVRFGFGMGIGINEKTSFSLGYKHDFIMETTVEGGSDGNSLDVGSLTFGLSYQVSDSVSINVNVDAGVTADAPDTRLMLRVPIKFDLM